ncbi:MAG: helix-turn-helix transcriptional regulator [Acidimicrobiaceae bacterium]|nr:helix-turn-helix transcriptional regulator [Acidimicrobiaceae bacterium]
MSEAVNATWWRVCDDELDSLIQEWNDIASRPDQPVPGWQLISLMVGEVLHRVRHGRTVYAEDLYEAAEMVSAAGAWRVEKLGGDPYAEWRTRVRPVFVRLAEGLPPRPVGNLQAHTVGERIRLRREAIGLTQDQLGRRVEVSFETVSRWERNVVAPRRRHRKLLASELGGYESEYDEDGAL